MTFTVDIISTGRIKTGPEKQQTDSYLKRCPWPVVITEVAERRPIKGDERKSREGDLILKALSNIGSGTTYIIVLDERGKSLNSKDFAHMIQAHRERGLARLVFVIGGAEGHDHRIREKADMLLCLSDMTWPHMLARVMLTEQIYRASCILSGHPYHKD